MASQFMIDTGELVEPHLTLTTRIAHSAKRMTHMVGDLLDFTRGSLGSGIPIVKTRFDLAVAVRHVVEEAATAHPGGVFQYNASGEVLGEWDCPRMSQVVSNLLGNAAAYGAQGGKIDTTLLGEANEAILRVHNYGTPIPTEELQGVFSPFKRVRAGEPASARSSGSLGLGLYIAEQIVQAHGGTISVRSSAEAGTLFTVRLPRL